MRVPNTTNLSCRTSNTKLQELLAFEHPSFELLWSTEFLSSTTPGVCEALGLFRGSSGWLRRAVHVQLG